MTSSSVGFAHLGTPAFRRPRVEKVRGNFPKAILRLLLGEHLVGIISENRKNKLGHSLFWKWTQIIKLEMVLGD